MSDWDISGYDTVESYDSGPLQFEFVSAPAFNGEYVEWSFRTVNHKSAPAGTVRPETPRSERSNALDFRLRKA